MSLPGSEESARHFQRPVLLNGITDVTGREDFRSRTVVVKLETIQRRRVERVLWEEFDAKQGQLLGALLNALSAALRILPNLDPDDFALPRMADFALLGIALEQGLGEPTGAFLASYGRNHDAAIDEAASVDTVVQMILWAMGKASEVDDRPQLMNTATDMWDLLSGSGPVALRRDTDWPTSARKFAVRLRRAAPVLASYGIRVDFDCRTSDSSRRRLIRITAHGAHKKAA
jgi:hypothetical protein